MYKFFVWRWLGNVTRNGIYGIISAELLHKESGQWRERPRRGAFPATISNPRDKRFCKDRMLPFREFALVALIWTKRTF
jgi:hypothetical protein